MRKIAPTISQNQSFRLSSSPPEASMYASESIKEEGPTERKSGLSSGLRIYLMEEGEASGLAMESLILVSATTFW